MAALDAAPPLLETTGLTRSFGGLTAVRDVDFRLEKGEVRAVIGPNGAGKTTFVSLISGRIAPSAGGLGSAELFVVVRDLPGLAPGVYHYFAYEHVLERLRATSDTVLAGALGLAPAELPPVLLVGTAHLTKVRQKYNDFAFRFGHLDAGVTRAFMDDLLRAAGVPYRDLVDARDAAVAEAISLPTVGTRNMVTFVWGLGHVEPLDVPAQVVAHQYVDMLAALSSRRTVPLRGPRPSTVAATALAAVGTVPPLQRLMLQRRSRRS